MLGISNDGFIESLFGKLKEAQDALLEGDKTLMEEIEALEVESDPKKLTPAEEEAEVFNDTNYELCFEGRNKFYSIKNPNHRLHGSEIVAGVAPFIYKDVDGNIRREDRVFYIDVATVGYIKNCKCSIDTYGYVRISGNHLHRMLVSADVVHHKNGRTCDNYLDNLEASDSWTNAQYKSNTKLGITKITLGTNARSTGTSKIFHLAYSGNYEEYVVACINKALHDIQSNSRAGKYCYINEFQMLNIAKIIVKTTALKADVAYNMFRIIEEINDSDGSLDSVLDILKKHNLPVRSQVEGAIKLLDRTEFAKMCDKKQWYIWSGVEKKSADVKKEYYGHKYGVVQATIHG